MTVCDCCLLSLYWCVMIVALSIYDYVLCCVLLCLSYFYRRRICSDIGFLILSLLHLLFLNFSFLLLVFCFLKQKTVYEMRISVWSSDVCSSDLDVDHSRGQARVDDRLGQCIRPDRSQR